VRKKKGITLDYFDAIPMISSRRDHRTKDREWKKHPKHSNKTLGSTGKIVKKNPKTTGLYVEIQKYKAKEKEISQTISYLKSKMEKEG
jgi:hypothetical protein